MSVSWPEPSSTKCGTLSTQGPKTIDPGGEYRRLGSPISLSLKGVGGRSWWRESGRHRRTSQRADVDALKQRWPGGEMAIGGNGASCPTATDDGDLNLLLEQWVGNFMFSLCGDCRFDSCGHRPMNSVSVCGNFTRYFSGNAFCPARDCHIAREPPRTALFANAGGVREFALEERLLPQTMRDRLLRGIFMSRVQHRRRRSSSSRRDAEPSSAVAAPVPWLRARTHKRLPPSRRARPGVDRACDSCLQGSSEPSSVKNMCPLRVAPMT